MNRGASLFWFLVVFLFGSSIFFGARVLGLGSKGGSVAESGNALDGTPGTSP